jgi:hypothetical protein
MVLQNEIYYSLSDRYSYSMLTAMGWRRQGDMVYSSDYNYSTTDTPITTNDFFIQSFLIARSRTIFRCQSIQLIEFFYFVFIKYILTSSVVSGALLNTGKGVSITVEFGKRLSNFAFGGSVSIVFL